DCASRSHRVLLSVVETSRSKLSPVPAIDSPRSVRVATIERWRLDPHGLPPLREDLLVRERRTKAPRARLAHRSKVALAEGVARRSPLGRHRGSEGGSGRMASPRAIGS